MLVDLINNTSNEYDIVIAYSKRKQTPDNFKDYFNSITLKYTFNSHEEHGSVPYYLFKQPLNIDVFHFNHHDKTIVGKIYHFRNEPRIIHNGSTRST